MRESRKAEIIAESYREIEDHWRKKYGQCLMVDVASVHADAYEAIAEKFKAEEDGAPVLQGGEG